MSDPGVVDQHIRAAKLLPHESRERVDARLVGHVAGSADGSDPVSPEIRQYRIHPCGVAGADGELATLGAEGSSDGATDALGSTRHNTCGIAEVHLGSLLDVYGLDIHELANPKDR